MDKFTLGIIAFPILFSMLAIRMPIGLAMLIVGCSGTILIAGWLPILSQVKTSAWHLFSNYSLSVIPLFLLMVLAIYAIIKQFIESINICIKSIENKFSPKSQIEN